LICLDNGEVGVFGIELKDGFSINIDATFAGT
jgi:hypothetical protein